LSKLNQLKYEVDWLSLNLRWFGYPQTRQRIFIIASKKGALKKQPFSTQRPQLSGLANSPITPFAPLTSYLNISWKMRSMGSLETLRETLRPEIGKKSPTGPLPFSKLGSSNQGQYESFDVKVEEKPLEHTLASIVAPNFSSPSEIKSGRFYARGAPSRLYLRKEPISHCVGSTIGGAPLFGVPLGTVNTVTEKEAFLQHANWYREQEDLLVMRLNPSQAVKLFGPYTDRISAAISDWNGPQTKKYNLVGNMVSPICAEKIASTINNQLSDP